MLKVVTHEDILKFARIGTIVDFLADTRRPWARGVNLIEIKAVRPHPNADRLEVVPVWGISVVVKKDEFKVGDLAVYIMPDYIVPTTLLEFSFLAKGHRGRGRDIEHHVKPRNIRGVVSFGLLIPAPSWLVSVKRTKAGGVDVENVIGSSVMKDLGARRHVPNEAWRILSRHGQISEGAATSSTATDRRPALRKHYPRQQRRSDDCLLEAVAAAAVIGTLL